MEGSKPLLGAKESVFSICDNGVVGMRPEPPASHGMGPPTLVDELDDELAPLDECSGVVCAHCVGTV